MKGEKLSIWWKPSQFGGISYIPIMDIVNSKEIFRISYFQVWTLPKICSWLEGGCIGFLAMDPIYKNRRHQLCCPRRVLRLQNKWYPNCQVFSSQFNRWICRSRHTCPPRGRYNSMLFYFSLQIHYNTTTCFNFKLFIPSGWILERTNNWAGRGGSKRIWLITRWPALAPTKAQWHGYRKVHDQFAWHQNGIVHSRPGKRGTEWGRATLDAGGCKLVRVKFERHCVTPIRIFHTAG